MDSKVRDAGVEEIENIAELDVSTAKRFTDIINRTNFLSLLSSTERPESLKLGVVEGKCARNDVREKIDRSKSAMVVVDMV
jgi:hypothetical protein